MHRGLRGRRFREVNRLAPAPEREGGRRTAALSVCLNSVIAVTALALIEKPRPSSKAAFFALLCVLSTAPGVAHANGRFPAASQVVFDPGRPEHLLVSSTFGLLESFDAAKTFTWTCEGALGLSGESDAMFAITENGNKVAATYTGIWLGRAGCSYGSPPELSGQIVPDLTLDSASPNRVLAFRTLSLGQGKFESALVLSEDQGETWTTLEPPLPNDLLPLSVDFSPSDSTRIYLSARSNSANQYRSELLRSDDSGRTFERFEIPDTTQQKLAFIAGVDANDADHVFLRVDDPMGTVLLASDDAGQSFHELFRGSGRLPGFALARDADELAFGGPNDGVWLGPSDGTLFEQRSLAAVSCLRYGPDGLYACPDSTQGGALLARSRDGGRSFETLLEFGALCGTKGCEATSDVARACRAEWESIAPTLGTTCGTESVAKPDGGTSPTVRAAGSGCKFRGGGGKEPGSRALVVSALSAVFALRARRARRISPRVVERSPWREFGPHA
jgi:hypothetical protein